MDWTEYLNFIGIPEPDPLADTAFRDEIFQLIENALHADAEVEREMKAAQARHAPRPPTSLVQSIRRAETAITLLVDHSSHSDSHRVELRRLFCARLEHLLAIENETPADSFEHNDDYSTIWYNGKRYDPEGLARILIRLCHQHLGESVTRSMLIDACPKGQRAPKRSSLKFDSILHWRSPLRPLKGTLIILDGHGGYKMSLSRPNPALR